MAIAHIPPKPHPMKAPAVHKAPPVPLKPGVKMKPITPLTPIAAPSDSSYMANMSSDQMNRNNQLAALNQQGSVDQTDTAEALRRLSQRRVQANEGYNASAARNNSLMSGRAMLGYGRMNVGYQQQSNDMQDQLARRMASRSLQQQQLLQGGQIYEGGQTAANTDRAVSNAYNNRLPLYLAQMLAQGKRV